MAIDVKKVLKKAKAGDLRDWTSSAIRLPNGTVLENVEVNSARDAQTFAQALDALSRVSPASLPIQQPAAPSPMLSERIQLFLSQFAQRKLSAKVSIDTAWSLKLFEAVVGNVPLSAIGRSETDAFLAALAVWPSNATKKKAFRGLSVKEVLAKVQKGSKVPSIALRTKEKHLDRLRVFFSWCVDRKELADNPIAKLHLTTKEQDNTPTRREFTTPELVRVFDPAAFAAFQKPHQYWAPLLSLYSGMRVNELAQLYVDDVDCVNDIWGVHVAARHPGQSLKNLSSWRFVPLHSKLLDLGLVAYRDHVRERGHQHLFPGLSWGVNGPGDGVSDWFGRYLDRVGLSDRALSFHSFRHTVATFLDRSEVLESRIAELTGHSRGQSVLRRVYIKAATLSARKADVERLVFPFVDLLKPVAPSRFERYLRSLVGKAARQQRAPKRTKA